MFGATPPQHGRWSWRSAGLSRAASTDEHQERRRPFQIVLAASVFSFVKAFVTSAPEPDRAQRGRDFGPIRGSRFPVCERVGRGVGSPPAWLQDVEPSAISSGPPLRASRLIVMRRCTTKPSWNPSGSRVTSQGSDSARGLDRGFNSSVRLAPDLPVAGT